MVSLEPLPDHQVGNVETTGMEDAEVQGSLQSERAAGLERFYHKEVFHKCHVIN